MEISNQTNVWAKVWGIFGEGLGEMFRVVLGENFSERLKKDSEKGVRRGLVKGLEKGSGRV